jgi:cytoskeletal protein CcmA (bactofilin family)
MLGFRRRRPESIDTLLAAGTRFEGNLVFGGGLRIDGEVRGDVLAAPGQSSVLVIGATGRVHGNLRAARMVVSGEVAGSIDATELLEVLAGARIAGELRYGALEVHPGAVLAATLRRVLPAAAPEPAATPAQAPLPAAAAA